MKYISDTEPLSWESTNMFLVIFRFFFLLWKKNGLWPKSRYQVVMMTNPGDMPLSYQILPAVDASKGDDLGSLQDLVDEAGKRC